MILDRDGQELDVDDVVVVLDGPHRGLVGMYVWPEAGVLRISLELLILSTLPVPASSVRLANDLERMRWLKAARERARTSVPDWLAGTLPTQTSRKEEP